MQQIKAFFRGKMKLAFPILSAYLLAILILNASLNYSAITRQFWLFLGILALFLAFLILYCCRNLANLTPKTASGKTAAQKRLIICVFPTVTFLLLFHYVRAFMTDKTQLPDTAVIFRILCFCAVFAWLAFVLYQNGCSAIFLLAFCLYLCVNPQFTEQLASQSSNITFMICAVILTAFYIQIICSNSEWLHSKFHSLLFALAAILCSCTIRYALLFTVPLVLSTIIYTVKKQQNRHFTILSFLCAVILISSLSSCLATGKASGQLSDRIGLPLSIWCNVMQTYSSALPMETQEFMYCIIPDEVYSEYTLNGGFQSISSSEQINYEMINALSIADVLKYTWQCFRYAPKESLEALAFTTHGTREISQNTYGIELLALLTVGVVLLSQNRLSILHALPLLCYNFGTTLLLGGVQASLFLLNIPLWPSIIFLMLADRTEFSSTPSAMARKTMNSPQTTAHTDHPELTAAN